MADLLTLAEAAARCRVSVRSLERESDQRYPSHPRHRGEDRPELPDLPEKRANGGKGVENYLTDCAAIVASFA